MDYVIVLLIMSLRLCLWSCVCVVFCVIWSEAYCRQAVQDKRCWWVSEWTGPVSGLHQHQQELLLFASAWKYYLQQQYQEILLLASVSGNPTSYISMEIFASATRGRTTTTGITVQQKLLLLVAASRVCGSFVFSETTGWWQTKLFLPVGVSSYTSHSSSSYASLPTNIYTYITYTYTTYTHISHCPACLHHCSLVELDPCLLAVWQLPGPETCTSSRFGFDRIRLDTLPATVCAPLHLQHCLCAPVCVCVRLCASVSNSLNKTPCHSKLCLCVCVHVIELDTLACHDGPDLAWKPKTLGATRHLVRSITVEVSAPRLLPSPGCTFPSCPTTSRPGAAQRQTGLGHYASQHQTGPAHHFHLALFNGFLQRTNTRIGSK